MNPKRGERIWREEGLKVPQKQPKWRRLWLNDYVDSFNGKLRDELLKRESFDTLLEAKVLIERLRQAYNTVRPHRGAGHAANGLRTPPCTTRSLRGSSRQGADDCRSSGRRAGVAANERGARTADPDGARSTIEDPTSRVAHRGEAVQRRLEGFFRLQSRGLSCRKNG